MKNGLRITLVDGRTLVVGFRELQLRDAHNRAGGALTRQEAVALLEGQPEPQRSSGLDLLERHHQGETPPRG